MVSEHNFPEQNYRVIIEYVQSNLYSESDLSIPKVFENSPRIKNIKNKTNNSIFT